MNTKVLVVVVGDSNKPVQYSNKVDVDLKTEIRAACDSLAIPHDDDFVNVIASYLENGDAYWFEEAYGFQLIEI